MTPALWKQLDGAVISCLIGLACRSTLLVAEQRRASMLGHGALPSPLPQLLWLTERCCQGYHLLILAHNFQPQWPGSAHDSQLTRAPRGLGRTGTLRRSVMQQQQQQPGFSVHWMFVVNERLHNGVSSFRGRCCSLRLETDSEGGGDGWGATDPLWSCFVLRVIRFLQCWSFMKIWRQSNFAVIPSTSHSCRLITDWVFDRHFVKSVWLDYYYLFVWRPPTHVFKTANKPHSNAPPTAPTPLASLRPCWL